MGMDGGAASGGSSGSSFSSGSGGSSGSASGSSSGSSSGGFGSGSGGDWFSGNSGGDPDPKKDNGGGQTKLQTPKPAPVRPAIRPVRTSAMTEAQKAETMGTASVLMSNIFGAGANFDKVNEIRAEMKRRGWKKKPGFSECDIYGTLHRFYAGWGYRRTPEYKIIDKKLENICSKMEEHGYKRDYSAITR